MWKKSFLPIFWSAVLWLPVACSDEPAAESGPAAGDRSFTVAEARTFFDAAPRTRTETTGSLSLGSFEPDWTSALPCAGWNLESVDVPVAGECFYRLPVGRDSLGRELGLRLTHRLVVLRQRATGELCSYLLFYLPDSTYAAAHPLQTAELCETLLSCEEKASFTGLALFTRTDGTPVAAQRYDEGMAGAGAYLFDARRTYGENRERLRGLIGRTRLWKYAQPQTRGLFNTNWIEPVTVTPAPNSPILIVIEVPPTPAINEGITEFSPLFPDGGGPGGSGSKDAKGNTLYEANRNLRTKNPAVLQLLDKLMEDCMGQVLIGAIERPVEIITDGTRVNGYTKDTNPPQIHLKMNPQVADIHDVILLEELFHAYQRQTLGDAAYDQRRLNCEIEAKLGWLMYRQREGNLTGIEIGLKGEFSRIAFEWLADAVRTNATQMINLSYLDAAAELRKKSLTYRNYTFEKADFSFNILNQLTIDCIKQNQL